MPLLALDRLRPAFVALIGLTVGLSLPLGASAQKVSEANSCEPDKQEAWSAPGATGTSQQEAWSAEGTTTFCSPSPLG